MLRENCNKDQLYAHEILDMVKAGVEGATDEMILWALFVLGDRVGLTKVASP